MFILRDPDHPSLYKEFNNLVKQSNCGVSCIHGTIDKLRQFHFYGKKLPKDILWPHDQIAFSERNTTYTLIRSYAKFLTKYPKSKKDCKKLILEKKKYIDFFMELTGTSPWNMICFVKNYIQAHLCKKCRKFTFLKCSACYSVYYCSVECQEKDWSDHRKKCDKEKLHITKRQPIRIQKYFEERNGKAVISYVNFMKYSYRKFMLEDDNDRKYLEK